MVIVGLIMAALTIYNYFSTPRTEAPTKDEIVGAKVSFGAVFPVFQKNKLGSCWPLYYYSAWANPSY
jgi:PAT family beta-lactamase induction signal transducer AmpG